LFSSAADKEACKNYQGKKMKKKWTLRIFIVVQIIGMFFGTSQPNYYGTRNAADFAMLVGWGLPFAIVGAIIGFFIDLYLHKKTTGFKVNSLLQNFVASPDTHVKCPDCRELVLKDARKCKHCGCSLIPQ
jgi:hypothetical protein